MEGAPVSETGAPDTRSTESWFSNMSGGLSFVSLNAATAVGPGVVKDLEGEYNNHTMLVFTTGSPTIPTYVKLEGSHDGVNWAVIGTTTTDFGDKTAVTVSTHFVRYVRANLFYLTGGTSPTVTATIATGGNND